MTTYKNAYLYTINQVMPATNNLNQLAYLPTQSNIEKYNIVIVLYLVTTQI